MCLCLLTQLTAHLSWWCHLRLAFERPGLRAVCISKNRTEQSFEASFFCFPGDLEFLIPSVSLEVFGFFFTFYHSFGIYWFCYKTLVLLNVFLHLLIGLAQVCEPLMDKEDYLLDVSFVGN